ncbi:hypothetical protein J4558_21965 [Leptolyngbya sp. 15MV]|nr:hypothetical protein J4558_21965 [Leptolyngbya sp. 15MV]
MGWAEDDVSALLARDVSTGVARAGTVGVNAVAAMAVSTTATGSAMGSSAEEDGGDTADESSTAQGNYASSQSGTPVSGPQPGAQTTNANNQAASQTANPGGQGGNAQSASTQSTGGQVRVAGALAGSVLLSSVSATGAPGRQIRADGAMTVQAQNSVGVATLATGLAFEDSAETTVGAAVAINVVELSTIAIIGDGANIQAASLLVEAGHGASQTQSYRALALAGSGSTQSEEGEESTAVAGSAALNIVTATTTASLGANSTVVLAAANADVTARQRIAHHAIAGGGALTLSDGGTSVGAAIGVNVLTNTTTASIGSTVALTATGAVNVLADAAILPASIIVPFLNDTGIEVTVLAIGAGIGSGGDAGAGSASINILTATTRATIGASSVITAGGNLTVRALDTTEVFNIAGALAGSLEKKGIGVGLDVTVITKATEAIEAREVVGRIELRRLAEQDGGRGEVPRVQVVHPAVDERARLGGSARRHGRRGSCGAGPSRRRTAAPGTWRSRASR